jgi:hypothetical protein
MGLCRVPFYSEREPAALRGETATDPSLFGAAFSRRRDFSTLNQEENGASLQVQVNERR